jgi:phosphatidylethanolamine/phosphatidyl-N-methylethanolamine N-methyltransferase
MSSDFALFRRRLIHNPRQISAIAPSSPLLARAMAKGLGPKTGRVVEFGPGTGRLTQGILDAGVPPGHLTLFEMDEEFGRHLKAKYPGIHLHITGAQMASHFVKPGVDAVISGLPLLSMPLGLQRDIMAAAFAILAPGAPMIQFTYGRRPPVSDSLIAEFGLTVEKGELIWANLPPARVYRFRKA